MSVFRPRNLNRRLVGTAGAIAGSPGNGSQIGPKKTPYCLPGGIPPTTIDTGNTLGCRFFGGGASCCSGRFKLNESFCGIRECCQCLPTTDCKGHFICCAGGTKWFVAPCCTEVARNWYNRGQAVTFANTCVGACGWFVPSCDQMKNPGYSCKSYWDCAENKRYWTDTPINGDQSWRVDLANGTGYSHECGGGNSFRNHNYSAIRVFRTV